MERTKSSDSKLDIKESHWTFVENSCSFSTSKANASEVNALEHEAISKIVSGVHGVGGSRQAFPKARERISEPSTIATARPDTWKSFMRLLMRLIVAGSSSQDITLMPCEGEPISFDIDAKVPMVMRLGNRDGLRVSGRGVYPSTNGRNPHSGFVRLR